MPRFLCSCLFLTLVLGLAGCTNGAAEEAAAQREEDPIFALLGEIDTDVLRQAFARLPGYAFTRRTCTVQRNDEGNVVATEVRAVRYLPRETERAYEILAHEQTGAFAVGLLGGAEEDADASLDAAGLADDIIPEDPPYLIKRNREAYHYSLRSDTLIEGRATQVIDITARPGEGGKQAIRTARLYVDRQTNTLVALYLERKEDTLFFGEDSRFFIQIQRDDGVWLPARTRADTRLDLPLAPPRHLRTEATYEDFAEVG